MLGTSRLAIRVAIACSGVAAAACGSALRSGPAAVAPVPLPPVAASRPAAPAPQTVDDPVPGLIARAEARFDAGRKELALGHLGRAKTEFNGALEVLLEAPGGAGADARVRECFDRLVDRISAYEMTALAAGDGFTEKTYEAASIDELLSIATFDRVTPSADLRAMVETDLLRTTHDVPIPLNDRVLAYIDLFLGRLRDWFQGALSRGGSYLPMIQSVLRAEGLPLDLAYVPIIESAFNPNALSRARAKGTWQFVRGTGVEYGLEQNWYVDERSNPEKSTVAAARYLKALRAQFDGNWHFALASYNGGPGLVQRAVKRTKIADFWRLIDKPRALPRETREYVPMILAAIVLARNPAQYGFEVTPDPPIECDRVLLTEPVDLRRVAEWAGASFDQMQALNPELRRWITPIRDPRYELNVPKGTAAIVEARLAEARPGEMATLNWHVVRRGETLAGIAKRLGVKRADLAGANDLTVRATVKPGQQLVIPVAPAALLAARADRPGVASTQAARVGSAPPVTTDAGAVQSGERLKVVYVVKAGDTLSSIARAFRTTVNALKTWNNLPSSRINIGDRLTIFTTRTDQPAP